MQFGAAGEFHDGLAAVKLSGAEGGKWGYVDRTGTLAIPARFTMAGRFNDGMAAAKVQSSDGELWGFIDKSGSFVIPPRFSEATVLADGLAPVRLVAATPGPALTTALLPDSYPRNAWGFVDARGALAIAPRFQQAGPFSQGLAAVCSGNKWGYIDKLGHWVIPPQFDEAREFREGFALVAVRNAAGRVSYGYVDMLGRYVLRPQSGVVNALHFSEGLAPLTVIRKWYERLSPLS